MTIPWLEELTLEEAKKEILKLGKQLEIAENKLRIIHEQFNDEHDIDCRNCRGET